MAGAEFSNACSPTADPMDRLAERLRAEVHSAPRPDCESADEVQARVDDILRPAGALARLDELAVWLAGWQRTTAPAVNRPVAVIFAGDHGVAAEGVSAYPSDVTAHMLAAFRDGKASISAMAAVVGAEVRAVDVGVGRPTANIGVEPAMSPSRFTESFEAGRSAVEALETDLLIVGEMGIGNTTIAAAVCGRLLDRPTADMVGAGTGLQDLTPKIAVVDAALARTRAEGVTADDPLQTLRHLGGTEVAAMAGAMFEARVRSIPVLLDGYISSAAALVLHRFDPATTGHLRAGHGSAESGHRPVLDAIGLVPLLDLGFRLGEASGAMAAVPLLQMACRLVTDVPTMTEWFGR